MLPPHSIICYDTHTQKKHFTLLHFVCFSKVSFENFQSLFCTHLYWFVCSQINWKSGYIASSVRMCACGFWWGGCRDHSQWAENSDFKINVWATTLYNFPASLDSVRIARSCCGSFKNKAKGVPPLTSRNYRWTNESVHASMFQHFSPHSFTFVHEWNRLHFSVLLIFMLILWSRFRWWVSPPWGRNYELQTMSNSLIS